MSFKERYTTATLAMDDKSGKELAKIVISNEAYSTNEVLEALIDKMEKLRLAL